MDLCVKSENGHYTTATLQVLRKHSTDALGELKNKLANNLPLLYFDTIQDELAKVLDILEELEKSGVQLEYYSIGRDERKIDKFIMINYFRSAEETSEQVDKEMEMEATEIVAAVDKTALLEHKYPIIDEDDERTYFLFGYSTELLDFIKNTQHISNIAFYQRSLGDEDMDEWEPIDVEKIHELMGID